MASRDGKLDRIEAKIEELQKSVANLCGQVGEMMRSEDVRARETTERRQSQDKIAEDVERRLRKLERVAALGSAYGLLASVVLGALVAWLFRLMPS
jgi:hypothetical protein